MQPGHSISSGACAWSFCEFWDRETVPLICLKCQVFGSSGRLRRPPVTVHGVVFDIFGEGRSEPAHGAVRKGRRLAGLSISVGSGLGQSKMIDHSTVMD